ncbi:MAG: hypothetical protein H0Z40_07080 [Desulfotomaculum sp.]|nr:hypothetical protein [Desulfotomaculum sp.]
MRLAARFTDKQQVNSLVDSLIKAGFDRKDMVITDLEKEHRRDSADEIADEVAFIKTETDSLWSDASFADEFPSLKGKRGTVVTVEMPKRHAARVRQMMKDAGADEIIQD